MGGALNEMECVNSDRRLTASWFQRDLISNWKIVLPILLLATCLATIGRIPWHFTSENTAKTALSSGQLASRIQPTAPPNNESTSDRAQPIAEPARRVALARVETSSPQPTQAAGVWPQDILQEILYMLDRPLDSEAARRLQQLLAQLAALGDPAIAVIRKYLLDGDDQDFSETNGIPYTTLRLALIDTLHRAGGEQAELASLELLLSRISTREFLALARFLERQEPGLFQPEIEQAGQKLLARAEEFDSAELGPVFKLLSETGAITPDLLEQSPWYLRHYARVALVLLPDGAGVPDLLASLQRSDFSFSNQLDRLDVKLLAQIAADHPEAAATLLDLASHGLIPNSLWPEIAAIATGLERIQLVSERNNVVGRHQLATPHGYQVLYRSRAGGPRDVDEALWRLQFIEQLYEAAEGSAARESLGSALDRLAKQLQGF